MQKACELSFQRKMMNTVNSGLRKWREGEENSTRARSWKSEMLYKMFFSFVGYKMQGLTDFSKQNWFGFHNCMIS